ncbi:vicilin-like seed storage protein At2g18540 [Pogonomyrmex barbatus]|uniref:Vicilin-like seed storage protein At2g18540 n=1 Tax=Pogonomyrmex barbatus TaxID=144034 RepID=A0A6I9WFZ0_9HYME|nr:vicilin-like seed storage protein At2g18540 [Pogonomyrmex barbatus]
MRIEVEKIKNELRIREEKWRKKKEEMKERIERIEKKLKRMKIESKVEEENKVGKRIRESAEVVEGKRNMEIDEWKERVRKLERRWETKEREDRRRNILIRGLKKREREKKIIEELLWKIEREVEMKEIRKIERGRREKGDMVIVKMRNEVMKRKILTNK